MNERIRIKWNFRETLDEYLSTLDTLLERIERFQNNVHRNRVTDVPATPAIPFDMSAFKYVFIDVYFNNILVFVKTIGKPYLLFSK